MLFRSRSRTTPPAGYYGYEGPPRRRRPVWPWVLSVLLLLAAAGAAWFAYTKIQDQLNANKPVSVPFVKGLTETLAVNKIHSAGLNPQIAREFSDSVEKGTVIDQSPDPGEKVQKHGNVDITVSKGRGYVSADRNKGSSTIGVIPVDSIFSPVRRVAYEVEAARVGQRTDYDKLRIDVTTDGSIEIGRAHV